MNDEIKENLKQHEGETLEPILTESDEVFEIVPVEVVREDDGTLSPAQKKAAIAIVAALALLLIVAFFVVDRTKKDAGDEAAKPDTEEAVTVSVKVAKAEKEAIAKEISALGTVAPAEQSIVSASISAQIKQMRQLKNAFVQKGEVLAVLASQDFSSQRNEANAALEEAKLNLQTLQKVTIPQTSAQNQKDLSDAKAVSDNARATYERRKDLYAKGGISLKEFEASQLVLTNAENALQLAEQNSKLNASAVNPNARAIAENKIRQAQERINTINTQSNLAEIRAPISGVVTEQFQFAGEFAAQGAKLLTIADIGSVIVKANFADSVVAGLQTGDAVTIRPNSAPDEQMGGKVTLISRSAEAQNRTVELWANFANGRGLLRVGDAVQFVVSSNPANDAVIVPVSAVQLEASNADEGTVMTVDDENIAHETKVKVGIKSGDKIQILEGLSGGETVVVEGNYALPDGTKVEVAKDDEKKDEEK